MEPNMKRMKTAVEEDDDENEEITIYLRVTKTVALKVKESDSIGNVKALLRDKEDVPEHLQHLFSEDNRLMDEQKLVDYGIRKNSTVYAYVEDSVPVMLYVKRAYAKGTITVNSMIYETIQDVKSRIGAKEGINSDEFSLIHDGKFIEDNRTLAFHNIDDGSTLHIVLNPKDKFLIPVVMPSYEIIQIEVKVTLFVRDVKTVIESRVGQSMNDMDLFLGKQKLKDQKELYQYDIKEDSLLQVVPRIIQIVIRKSNGQEITLDVHQHELIKNVKGMIQNKLGIPVHLQNLVFNGNGLADSRDIASYDIENDSTLHLNDRS
ncbi:polyubiquitin 4 [Nicotiana attenuata]|uniref:Polyubiquitin 4 n=1 Tax=Nicotiana attenuata TaxID=49451 RepID=A0A314LHJ9_NICAT|nr:polyubiquitin 4 [Nicotiana attenuata]